MTNDFVPPYSATIPSNINSTDHPIDFFEFARIARTPGFNVSRFQCFKVVRSKVLSP